MKEEAQNALADLTYFRALDAAKKLSQRCSNDYRVSHLTPFFIAETTSFLN